MTHLINESINDEAVYRTAPATPGLLITFMKTVKTYCKTFFTFHDYMRRWLHTVVVSAAGLPHLTEWRFQATTSHHPHTSPLE